MLIYLPNLDRRAAALAGFEPGPRPSVTIALADLGGAREQVVERLAFDDDGSATLKLSVTEPTAAGVVAAVKAAIEKEEAEAAKRQAELDAWESSIRAAIAAWRAAEPAPTKHDGGYKDGVSFGQYDGFGVPGGLPSRLIFEYHSPLSWEAGESHPLWQEFKVAQADLQARVDAADAKAREAAEPVLLAQWEANKTAMDKRQAEEEEKEAARQRRLDEVAAERLRTGYWEREWPAYNARRYTRPWCAKVTGVDSRGKLSYGWGESTGSSGGVHLLRVPCKPGDVIAYGQKDTRGNKGDHYIVQMEPSGRMIEITAAKAAKVLRG